MQPEFTPHSAVRANGIYLLLLRVVPGPITTHLKLRTSYQRACRADRHAVAAVDARRLSQRDIESRIDVRAKAAARSGEREGMLRVRATRLDTLVAEDAPRIVAHVKPVVGVPWRLLDSRAAAVAVRLGVVARRELLDRRGQAGIHR